MEFFKTILKNALRNLTDRPEFSVLWHFLCNLQRLNATATDCQSVKWFYVAQVTDG